MIKHALGNDPHGQALELDIRAVAVEDGEATFPVTLNITAVRLVG